MIANLENLFGRLQFTAFLVITPFLVFHSDITLAEESRPFASLPESVVGMTSGTLQPKNSSQAYIGSAQTSRESSGGQTGRQVYFGGLRYRGAGPWQVGASISIFDDVPGTAISDRFDSLTYIGLGLDLKYQLYQSDRLSAALLGGVETAYYSRGKGLTTQSSVAPGDKDRFWASTISIPITYRLSDQLWATGELGYTHAAKTIAGEKGLGGRAFASTGLGYQVSDRLFYYGAVKVLARQIGDGIDAQDQGGRKYIYTFGAQYALTPQSALNLYVTNAFSPTPTGDDLLFFPDKSASVFGIMLQYTPSGRGVGEKALTFRSATRSAPEKSRFADGFTINAPHTLASDRVRTRLSFGTAGQSALSVYYTPDPDFQLELSIEDYALGLGSNFRSEAEEDLRFMIGGRWQAMDEAYGHSFNLGFGIAAGRDFEKPSIGTLFVEASASKAFNWGEAVVNARSAIYASETLAGFGMLLSYDLSQTTTAIGEYTAVLDDSPVWAIGLRHSPRRLPFSIDFYSTNAAGLNGLGSLLSNNEPQFGISLHWEGGLNLL